MDYQEVIGSLEMSKGDVGIPKSLKTKINNIIAILNNKEEDKEISCHKVVAILEEVSNDSSLQPFIRTQIYQIISLF